MKEKTGKKLTLAAMQKVMLNEFGGPTTLKEFRSTLRAQGYEISYDRTKAYWEDLFTERQRAAGSIAAPDEGRPVAKGKRFIVTSAQNNTYVHDKLWSSLKTMARVRGAEILVCRYSYNRSAWESAASKALRDSEDSWYDPAIAPYVHSGSLKLADGLVLCGELDILPTAKQPLLGLANYTGHNSGIVPHAKQVLESYPRVGTDAPRFMYTTGTVTQRNYIDRRAGQVAAYHHIFGALYVEVDDDGDWFVRQLNTGADGVVYDLWDVFYPDGSHASSDTTGIGVTFGDIHAGSLAEDGVACIESVVKSINPERMYIHDLIDFNACNPHSGANPSQQTLARLSKGETVEANIAVGSKFLTWLSSIAPASQIKVVPSNHDEFLRRWLDNPKGFDDWQNRRIWLSLNTMLHANIEVGNFNFDVFKTAVTAGLPESVTNVEFLAKDTPHVWRGIEHSLHGHLGPNGARGNPSNLKAVGLRVNTGHTHSCCIRDGLYCAGTMAELRMGYNIGPSSWSCSFIFTYPNEKRTMITARGRKWHA